ncbi:MAG: universal stress protein [Candidatus Palauibacterales bacterium]|nr:universal stress protein [Candidatus Palauibacterales bacterium]
MSAEAYDGTDGDKLRVLVSVDVPDPEQISPLLIEMLEPLRVCLLGTYVVPEQTAPEQAREQFESETSAALEEVAAVFDDAGVEVERQVVFVPDRLEAAERTAVEQDCHAVLLVKPVYSLKRILAAVRPGPMDTRILHVLGDLLRDTDYSATLLYVAPEEEGEEEDGRTSRKEMRLLERELVEQEGVDADRIATRVAVGDDPEPVVEEAARDHDVVLIGETKPSVQEKIFGSFSRRLADDTDRPVLVVRREL